MKNNDLLKNIDPVFRGGIFWSLNERLEKKEIVSQIKGFKKAGLGGFFMHSRAGLKTPYMGKEWMKLIGFAIKEAKKNGLYAYLYDEDKWPSGFAGGVVPEENPDFRQKLLVCFDEATEEKDFVLVKMIKVNNKHLYFYQKTVAPGDSWFNGQCYIDLLNPEVTDAFIKSTHERYKSLAGEEFGKTIPALFTDEPAINLQSELTSERYKYYAPWTDTFPAYFRKKSGYDILPKLAGIFFKPAGYEKVRHDYWKTVSSMFAENFTKRIYNWCSKNKLAFTGHFMWEDIYSAQIYYSGSAMPHYEYLHWPGIDHLGWYADRNGMMPMLVTIKQVTSVAHQLNKERTLSEIHGGSGWGLTFAAQKWLGDFDFALGINFRCQHLAHYSLLGIRKRDWIPSMNYQQKWWNYYKYVEDYFAGLGVIMTRGKYKADVLLLSSISSAWCLFENNDKKGCDKISDAFKNISYLLADLHRDHEYGDEVIIKKYGKVKDGKFIVGSMSYKLVVVPPALSLFKNTVKLLEKFVKDGGKCIMLKPLPVYIEGSKNRELLRLYKNENVVVIDNNNAEIEKTIDKLLPRDVSISGRDGKEINYICYHHRVDGKKHVYFFVNRNENLGYDAKIQVAVKGIVSELNPGNGQEKHLNSLDLYFSPGGSHLITVDETKEQKYVPGPFESLKKTILLDKKWKQERKDYNSVALDYCEYRINNGGWSKKLPLSQVQLDVRKFFGLKDGELIRQGFDMQYWKKYEKLIPTELGVLELKYKFNVSALSGRILLALETPEAFRIFINNKEVQYNNEKSSWWTDKAFRTVDVKKFVRNGKNEIILKSNFKEDMELEAVYIIGDFGVFGTDNKKFSIGIENKYLSTGDWGRQGYKFYSGEMVYRQNVKLDKLKGEKIYLEADKISAVVTRVLVNGKFAGYFAWQPHKLEITALVKKGENMIEIEVIAGLRNLLGPHHAKDLKKWEFVRQATFSDMKRWTDRYNFEPYGLEGEVRIKIHKQTKTIH